LVKNFVYLIPKLHKTMPIKVDNSVKRVFVR
jgi:hypothetical protein